MGATNRQSGPGLTPAEAILPREAWKYSFFHAVRLLEAHFPGSPRLGGRGPAHREPIRLRTSPSFGHPKAEVESISVLVRSEQAIQRVELVTTFLGLLGVQTPLPRSYAEEVLLQEEEPNAMRAFVDLFQHRLLSLLYAGWLRHRVDYVYQQGATDPLSRALLDRLGLSPEMSAKKLGLSPEALLFYLGLFLLPTRPAEGLEVLLSDALVTTVRVQQLPARWIDIDAQQQFRLQATRGRKGRLGQDIILGSRVYDRSGAIRLIVGPIEPEIMTDFEPGGKEFQRLQALTRLYVRQPLDLEIELHVSGGERASVQVGGPHPARLGRMTRIGKMKTGELVKRFDADLRGG